jgi:hypothetical protein
VKDSLVKLVARERFARQVVAARVAPYIEPPSDKALGDSLRESLLGKQVAP